MAIRRNVMSQALIKSLFEYNDGKLYWRISPSQNQSNGRTDAVNSTGFKGVAKHFNRFYAYIRVNKKTKNLGYFDTAEEAHIEYLRFKGESNECH